MSSLNTSQRDIDRGIGLAGLLTLTFFLAAQFISQIASLKVATVFGLAVDMGTFLYPFTFTLRDMIHKNLGKKTAQIMIFATGGMNLLLAAFLGWTASMPPDEMWNTQTIPGVLMDSSFNHILGPIWNIIIASIVAEVISELVDTEVFSRIRNAWRRRFGQKFQWVAVLGSNAISIPLDSFIFCMGAFAFRLPMEVVWGILLTNILLKFAVTLVSLPGIYLVKEKPHATLEEAEKD